MTTAAYIRRKFREADPPFLDMAGRSRLVQLRTHAGLSIEAVASRLGIDPDRWRDIEEGWERPPSGELLTRWARWLEDQASPGWREETP